MLDDMRAVQEVRNITPDIATSSFEACPAHALYKVLDMSTLHPRPRSNLSMDQAAAR